VGQNRRQIALPRCGALGSLRMEAFAQRGTGEMGVPLVPFLSRKGDSGA
jgi:hypothetical protein